MQVPDSPGVKPMAAPRLLLDSWLTNDWSKVSGDPAKLMSLGNLVLWCGFVNFPKWSVLVSFVDVVYIQFIPISSKFLMPRPTSAPPIRELVRDEQKSEG